VKAKAMLQPVTVFRIVCSHCEQSLEKPWVFYMAEPNTHADVPAFCPHCGAEFEREAS
jgi:hypothetical protein